MVVPLVVLILRLDEGLEFVEQALPLLRRESAVAIEQTDVHFDQVLDILFHGGKPGGSGPSCKLRAFGECDLHSSLHHSTVARLLGHRQREVLQLTTIVDVANSFRGLANSGQFEGTTTATSLPLVVSPQGREYGFL